MSGKNEPLGKFSCTQDELLIEYVQENKVIFDNSDQKQNDVKKGFGIEFSKSESILFVITISYSNQTKKIFTK